MNQHLAETTYQPPGTTKNYRLVVRRQLISNRRGQELLFDEYRYRYVVTNLPARVSAEEVIDLTYERCDQENLIEQMGSGLAAWRMPVAEFDGNSAWLEIARLAWNMAKWIAQLALPPEVVRWEWKRFRLHYVLVAAGDQARSPALASPPRPSVPHRPVAHGLRYLVALPRRTGCDERAHTDVDALPTSVTNSRFEQLRTI